MSRDPAFLWRRLSRKALANLHNYHHIRSIYIREMAQDRRACLPPFRVDANTEGPASPVKQNHLRREASWSMIALVLHHRATLSLS